MGGLHKSNLRRDFSYQGELSIELSLERALQRQGNKWSIYTIGELSLQQGWLLDIVGPGYRAYSL